MEKEHELFFWNINSVAELQYAEQRGFSVNYKSISLEMPGAKLIHQAVRKCNMDLLAYLINDCSVDINELDDDVCTPLGYIANDELLYDLSSWPELFSTVNNGCTDINKILEVLIYLIGQNAHCRYNGKTFDHHWLMSFVTELRNRA
jgi:hypothetical protein